MLFLRPAHFVLVGAVALLVLLSGSPRADLTSEPGRDALVPASTTTFRPGRLAATAQVFNPLRGEYRWMGYGTQVPDWDATRDLYHRDQVYWGRIERSDNQFDFSVIDAGLADAGSRKASYGFRVMAYCPSCWMEFRADKEEWPPIAPPFLPMQGDTTVPAWNQEAFLAQWEELVAELGRRYADDPRLGYVDIGGYGRYGEWWTRLADGAKITDANAIRMIDAVARAFPRKHVLLNTMLPVDLTLQAVNRHPNLGLRTDCLGAPDMHSMVAADQRLQGLWRTRPFISEWCVSGDPEVGRDQVTRYHVSTTSSRNMRLKYPDMTSAQKTAYVAAMRKAGYAFRVNTVTVPSVVRRGSSWKITTRLANLGSAPTYDDWRTRFYLTRDGTTLSRRSGIDLQRVLPGTSTRSVTLGTRGLTPGKWKLWVQVVDPTGYRDPMQLHNTGRTAEGRYRLGTVRVR